MKWLSIVLAFVGAGALACPADDVKDAQANVPSKPMAAAKAAPPTAAKPVASKKTQSTKVADKATAETAPKSSL
ncbi:MAG TPA: hypothetical protein VI032_12790 [Burkholderiaceae bacterium]